MIKCFFLCKDHTTQIRSANTKKDWAVFHKGWYNLDRRFAFHEGDDSTFYFLEGNPQPINCKEDSIRFLATIGFKSLIAQFQGKTLNPWGEVLIEYIRDPAKILSLGIVIFILVAITLSLVGPYL